MQALLPRRREGESFDLGLSLLNQSYDPEGEDLFDLALFGFGYRFRQRHRLSFEYFDSGGDEGVRGRILCYAFGLSGGQLGPRLFAGLGELSLPTPEERTSAGLLAFGLAQGITLVSRLELDLRLTTRLLPARLGQAHGTSLGGELHLLWRLAP